MNLATLDIPDDPALWPAWLESHIMGMDLGQLVLELQVIFPDRQDESAGLEDVCGGRLNEVMESGLAALSDRQVRRLLNTPKLLLSLQERVLIDGGDYWQDILGRNRDQYDVHQQWQNIARELQRETSGELNRHQADGRSRLSAGRRWAIVAAAAAAVAVAIAVFVRSPEPAAGWGWDRPGALAVDAPPDRYLNHLADAATEWFNKRPETRAGLSQRLREFRDGCETLIEAEHPQLAESDRQWLRERCRAWAEKLDDQRHRLNAGEDVSDVREAADETITRLIDALRERAKTVG